MKFLKKLLTYLKQVFKKDNKKNVIVDSDKYNELELDVQEEAKIIPEALSEENIQKKTEVVFDETINNLISDIEIGDIIWTKRYNDEKQKQNIPEGHQEGPCLVVGKTEDGLICAKGTGVAPYEEYVDNRFCVWNGSYSLNKNTFFQLNQFRVIDTFSFCYKLSSLIVSDREKLLKKIKEKKHNFYCIDGEKKNFDVDFFVGDLISINKKNYIILNKIDNKIICVGINTYKEDLKVNDVRYLDYLNLVNFDIECDKPEYIGTISSTLLAYSLKREKEYIENYKNKMNPQRGSVIVKDNELNYIYGEEGQIWLTFEIKYNNYDLFDKIKIGTETFYTEYNKKNISKKESFDTILLAFPEEIEDITSKRKSYKYRLENELQKRLIKNRKTSKRK